MKLTNPEECRPAKTLELTIDIVRESLNKGEAVTSYSDMFDILYHLENFKHLLDWMNSNKEVIVENEMDPVRSVSTPGNT